MPSRKPQNLDPVDTFARRHLGPSDAEVSEMLGALGLKSLDELVAQTVPATIRTKGGLDVGAPRGEHELLEELRGIARKNVLRKSFIGTGYQGTVTPPIILRNILENPGWYTQYTPYQAEISQGRLEALLNCQTMVCDLTGLPMSNASLLDEATAAAEAMVMCKSGTGGQKGVFFVDAGCHPQVAAVVKTRAKAIDVTVQVGDARTADFAKLGVFGVLVAYPATDGRLDDPRPVVDKAHAAGALVVAATDLLALTLLTPPGELGVDVAIGSAQRFGVPMGFGGPHAAFMSTTDKLKRVMPGRVIGVSKDSQGRPALRLALQTREQHIRREKATSNICTAQVLLAIMASMYAVYHGPKGLTAIATRVHELAQALAAGLKRLGVGLGAESFFDTLHVLTGNRAAKDVVAAAEARGMNLRLLGDKAVGVALDETTTVADVTALLEVLSGKKVDFQVADLDLGAPAVPAALARKSAFLSHPVFNTHHSETEMLRYMHRLEQKDLALNTAMIPLGSCTMKLNGTAEMIPVTWPELANLHPFAPPSQAAGYKRIVDDLSSMLAAITGLPAVSLQPNAGSQGEYTGLLVIRRYHDERGDKQRRVVLIPQSAHGTNPASAVMAGLRVVVTACDAQGNVDLGDLRAKAKEHAADLAALMVTYPSTHGVFEEGIVDICKIIHEHGGLVYMDGANLNAQVGLSKPGEIGADVCHVNLHKTFAIPHGGGGPGMGPIGVTRALAPYLPGHPLISTGGDKAIGPVSAAPFGSASILPISWMYMKLMGDAGLKKATEVAILNANYMAKRLESHYPVLYRGKGGRVAHEFIIDLRPFKDASGVEAEDVAKRLADYGFHAPTMSFPVPGTLMIEPTESEPKRELDRFCDAMIAIRAEIQAIADGKMDRAVNALKMAPHTAEVVTASEWARPYRREQGAFPTQFTRDHKYWPAVGRIDNAWGDRNLVCTCPPTEDYGE